MLKIILARKTILPVLLLSLSFSIYSQAITSSQPHEGKVNEVFACETEDDIDSPFFSVGNDGFIIKWEKDGMGEHYQVSDLQARLVSRNPVSGDIAIYETDGISTHKITVIDANTYAKKFSRKFANSVVCINFSSKGKYLLVGTTAVNGVFALNATTGAVVKKIEDISGIVPLILTGSSEKNAVMYSKSGMLYYYDLSIMKVKTKFPTVSSLEQTILFGTEKLNNRFFAGVKDNTVYIIDATSGKTLAQYQGNSPLIFASRLGEEEKQGLYFIFDKGKNFSLEFVSQELLLNLLTGSADKTPVIIKSFTGLQSRDKFTCVAKNSETIMLGTQSGSLYTITDIPEVEPCTLLTITENMYEKIYDIESDGNFIYFLTQYSLFKTSYNSRSIVRLGENSSQTNMLMYKDGTILWSKGTKKTVQFISLDEKNNTQTLFIPESQLMSLRLLGDRLVYVLGTSTVGIYDIMPKEEGTDSFQVKNTIIYSGTSIQDALLVDENTVIIAKTATDPGDSPLVSVNIKTQETVPIKLSGSVAFSLCLDRSKEDSYVYGILIDTVNNSAQTQLFSYNTKTEVQTAVLGVKSEDYSAFTEIARPLLLTNIGKNQVSAFNLNTNNMSSFKRSASMPLKAVISKGRLAVLNYNGSVSWYNITSGELLADWYLTKEGEWFEF